MKNWIVCVLMLLGYGFLCQAEPNLDQFHDIGEVRIFKDHENPTEWYLAPSRPVLNHREDKTPDYGLALYRYLGRRGTSDSGKFWVRGVLTFGLERSRDAGGLAKIRKELRAMGIKSPRTKSMPVSAVEVNLLFSDQQYFHEQKIRWKSGTMVIPLDAHIAEVLWDAVEAGQTLVSVSIAETLVGVRKIADNWEPSTTVLSWTVPVEMDKKAYPDHFQRIDLGGRMKVGYTGLDVFCFDFIENLEEKLYAKIVEVAIPTTGRDLVETVTFKDDGTYRSRIEFKMAKDLDQTYRYRISRIWQDGSKETSLWQEKSGEALLDITAYNNTNNPNEETDDESENQ